MDASALAMRIPQPQRLLRSERCEKCKWSEPVPNDPQGILECHIDPPKPSAIVVGTRRAPNGHEAPLVQTFSSFPTVQPVQWCSRWQPKIEAAQ